MHPRTPCADIMYQLTHHHHGIHSDPLALHAPLQVPPDLHLLSLNDQPLLYGDVHLFRQGESQDDMHQLLALCPPFHFLDELGLPNCPCPHSTVRCPTLSAQRHSSHPVGRRWVHTLQ